MPDKDADDQVTFTDYRKTEGVVEDSGAEKHPVDCDCEDSCDCDGVSVARAKLRGQIPLVMRIDTQVSALLEKALASG